MKLSKATRTKIRLAAEPIEIQWPVALDDPVIGREYPVGRSLKVLVLARRRTPKRWKVTVKKYDDPIYAMRMKAHVPGGIDPATGEEVKTEYEPEKVAPAYQRRISEEGRLKTVLAGAEQRQRMKVLAEEQRALDAQKKEKSGTVRYIERVEEHRKLKEAA